MHPKLTTVQLIIVFIIIAPFLMAQGAWIFKDSKKRGSKNYFLWGLFGLLNIPESLVVYLIVTRIIFKKKK